MTLSRRLGAAAAAVFVLAIGAAAGAAVGDRTIRGGGPGAASLSCPGGMTRLGHELAEDMSVFAFDPAVHIELEYTVAEDFFLVEDIDTGSHAGTHLDVPAHFIEGGRTVDELAADEFVWPVYKIDVRGRTFDGDIPFITVDDIVAYEAEHGPIPRTGALVVLQTGAEQFWGAEEVVVDEDGNAANVDDFFDFANPGFSGEAVQWLFDNRKVAGVGSDAYGPDAAGDENFDATFTALANDGVALVALANLDAVNVRGDLILAPTVALADGSGFSTDPIACHGNTPGHPTGQGGRDR
jgi:kynurenine formamidase